MMVYNRANKGQGAVESDEADVETFINPSDDIPRSNHASPRPARSRLETSYMV